MSKELVHQLKTAIYSVTAAKAFEAGEEIESLREQVTLLRNSVEELIPENPCDTEHQYKVHHRALEALTATEPAK